MAKFFPSSSAMRTPDNTAAVSGEPETLQGRVLARLQKGKVYMDRDVMMELQEHPQWGKCIVYTAKPSKFNGHLLVAKEACGPTREEELYVDNQFVHGFSQSSGGISSWGNQSSIDTLRTLGIYVDENHPKPIHAILSDIESGVTVEPFFDLGEKDKFSIKNNDPDFCEEFDAELAEVRGRLRNAMGND